MSGVVGIDVSSYQRTVNWASYKSQKRVFAYVKATEGNSYKNPYFASQYGGAAKAGLIRGAYHFGNPSGASGKAQADYFVKHGGAWVADGKTLPGVLDIEYNPYGGNTCYGLSKTAMVSWISAFVTEYKKKTTRDAVIYTTPTGGSAAPGHDEVQPDQPTVGRPLRHQHAGHAAREVAVLHVLAVQLEPDRPEQVQRQLRPAPGARPTPAGPGQE